MSTVILVIHMMLAVALITVILMQRSAQDGGGLMSGSSTMGGLFTARGSANLLTRTTAVLATSFICTSLILGIMAGHRHNTDSLVEQIATSQAKDQDATKAAKADNAKADKAKAEGAMKKEAPAAPAKKAEPQAKKDAPKAPQVPVSK